LFGLLSSSFARTATIVALAATEFADFRFDGYFDTQRPSLSGRHPTR